MRFFRGSLCFFGGPSSSYPPAIPREEWGPEVLGPLRRINAVEADLDLFTVSKDDDRVSISDSNHAGLKLFVRLGKAAYEDKRKDPRGNGKSHMHYC
jgi:hypothetical protein